MNGGDLINLLPKTVYEGGYLSGASPLTFETIIKPAIDVISYSSFLVMLRLHSKSADPAAAVSILLREVDPSREDGQDFVITAPVLTVGVTAASSAPSLVKSSVIANPGPYLRCIVSLLGSTTANGKATFEISADMICRSGI
jgi:hypothetical protein